jgi:hypothetical protein
MTRPKEPIFMYIGFIDDSGSTGSNLTDPDSKYQVIGGPIIEDRRYLGIEAVLLSGAQDVFGEQEEEDWEKFEFKACDLFHCHPPFDKLGPEKCLKLMQESLEWMRGLKIPIIYGAVDKVRLNNQVYKSAKPADMAFRLYLDSIGRWFEQKFVEQEPAKGILICDDSRKSGIRHTIELVFRELRKKPQNRMSFGLTQYLFDDMYFGDSKNSTGIQMADLCVFAIARNLAHKPDKGLFDIIKDNIFETSMFP